MGKHRDDFHPEFPAFPHLAVVPGVLAGVAAELLVFPAVKGGAAFQAVAFPFFLYLVFHSRFFFKDCRFPANLQGLLKKPGGFTRSFAAKVYFAAQG